ncbi:hypothetical protein CPB83DRAFT_867144 [Crepidotus variabilis]|uniref:Uncharacterized protein n=1 Tax=Crepidotus variabilis TaxID=179855 RepID=A0A9P6JUP5_9AGAR|nr:hypothetical protein CPB83DRAFT_867144 [Crepidotus variabilis]
MQHSSPGLRRYSSGHRVVFIIPLLLIAALSFVVHGSVSLKKLTTYYTSSLRSFPDNERPPDYSELRAWESNLPQHDPDLSFPEGRSGRYVLFSSSRINLSGWNNKLNDMLMNTWLAYASNRAYVFHDFTWVNSHYPWPASIYREWAPRTPLNALLSGPSAGGPWDIGDIAPRSISEIFFDIVCPQNERRIINTRTVKSGLGEADGQVIFDRWRTILMEVTERCVEVVAPPADEDPFPEIFDIHYWSGPRSISVWEEFLQSPISRLLKASPIVNAAIRENIAVFSARSVKYTVTAEAKTNKSVEHLDLFKSVLSIHVRRGDFQQACLEHASSNSTFYNWNLLPFLPDEFHALPNHRDNQQQILDHCWPTAQAILAKVNLARMEYEHTLPPGQRGGQLKVLYVMSNDRTDWIRGLQKIFESDGWAKVVLSRDLILSPQQRDVSVAVDMEIGRRSKVFIGNGWSSFTSNVVHQRLADNKVPISIRFW